MAFYNDNCSPNGCQNCCSQNGCCYTRCDPYCIPPCYRRTHVNFHDCISFFENKHGPKPVRKKPTLKKSTNEVPDNLFKDANDDDSHEESNSKHRRRSVSRALSTNSSDVEVYVAEVSGSDSEPYQNKKTESKPLNSVKSATRHLKTPNGHNKNLHNISSSSIKNTQKQRPRKVNSSSSGLSSAYDTPVKSNQPTSSNNIKSRTRRRNPSQSPTRSPSSRQNRSPENMTKRKLSPERDTSPKSTKKIRLPNKSDNSEITSKMRFKTEAATKNRTQSPDTSSKTTVPKSVKSDSKSKSHTSFKTAHNSQNKKSSAPPSSFQKYTKSDMQIYQHPNFEESQSSVNTKSSNRTTNTRTEKSKSPARRNLSDIASESDWDEPSSRKSNVSTTNSKPTSPSKSRREDRSPNKNDNSSKFVSKSSQAIVSPESMNEKQLPTAITKKKDTYTQSESALESNINNEMTVDGDSCHLTTHCSTITGTQALCQRCTPEQAKSFIRNDTAEYSRKSRDDGLQESPEFSNASSKYATPLPSDTLIKGSEPDASNKSSKQDFGTPRQSLTNVNTKINNDKSSQSAKELSMHQKKVDSMSQTEMNANENPSTSQTAQNAFPNSNILDNNLNRPHDQSKFNTSYDSSEYNNASDVDHFKLPRCSETYVSIDGFGEIILEESPCENPHKNVFRIVSIIPNNGILHRSKDGNMSADDTDVKKEKSKGFLSFMKGLKCCSCDSCRRKKHKQNKLNNTSPQMSRSSRSYNDSQNRYNDQVGENNRRRSYPKYNNEPQEISDVHKNRRYSSAYRPENYQEEYEDYRYIRNRTDNNTRDRHQNLPMTKTHGTDESHQNHRRRSSVKYHDEEVMERTYENGRYSSSGEMESDDDCGDACEYYTRNRGKPANSDRSRSRNDDDCDDECQQAMYDRNMLLSLSSLQKYPQGGFKCNKNEIGFGAKPTMQCECTQYCCTQQHPVDQCTKSSQCNYCCSYSN